MGWQDIWALYSKRTRGLKKEGSIRIVQYHQQYSIHLSLSTPWWHSFPLCELFLSFSTPLLSHSAVLLVEGIQREAPTSGLSPATASGTFLVIGRHDVWWLTLTKCDRVYWQGSSISSGVSRICKCSVYLCMYLLDVLQSNRCSRGWFSSDVMHAWQLRCQHVYF